MPHEVQICKAVLDALAVVEEEVKIFVTIVEVEAIAGPPVFSLPVSGRDAAVPAAGFVLLRLYINNARIPRGIVFGGRVRHDLDLVELVGVHTAEQVGARSAGAR